MRESALCRLEFSDASCDRVAADSASTRHSERRVIDCRRGLEFFQETFYGPILCSELSDVLFPHDLRLLLRFRHRGGVR
jgi:hypothetical protein